MIARTEHDIEILKEGGRRLGTILKDLSMLATPGATTHMLENEARKRISEGGDTAAFLGYTPEGAERAYPAALCVSINDAIVHGIPNEEEFVLQVGDLVTLDMGLIHRGLITDAAISLSVGGAEANNTVLLKVAHEALDAGIQAARAGNRIGDIGAAVERVAKKYEINYPRELGGHSVGQYVHEEPFIANFGTPGTGPVIEEGMVLAIEPMFMLGKAAIKLDGDGYTYRTKDGSKAVHVEHTVLVTKEGPHILTKAA